MNRKNNKKGFTLIELLAVIIILAVIALIATPIVLNVVDNAKKQANKNSVYGLIDASKLYYAESMLDESKSSKVNGSINLIDEIKISGDKPDSGSVYIDNTGNIALAVVYDKVCYKKNFSENEITESSDVDNCSLNAVQPPQVLKYYEFGLPTTSSSTNFQDVITSSGSNTFIQKEGEQLSVCIYRNNTLECFKNNNFSEEGQHLQSVFGADRCYSEGFNMSCIDHASGHNCDVYGDGYATCGDDANRHSCSVDADGIVDCY